jgi:hypothetical protein
MRKEENDFTKYVMVMKERSTYRYPLLYRTSIRIVYFSSIANLIDMFPEILKPWIWFGRAFLCCFNRRVYDLLAGA